MVRSDEVMGDDDTDTLLLRQMAVTAERYLASFSWCGMVYESYFAEGVGGIFAVFLMRIEPQPSDIGSWLWVMVGDVPHAYLPVTDCASYRQAYRLYLQGMDKWVELALQSKAGTPDEGVPPVNVPSTPEWGDRLRLRLQALRLAVGGIFEDTESYVQ